MKKRILSLLLALAMTLALCAVPAFAEGDDDPSTETGAVEDAGDAEDAEELNARDYEDLGNAAKAEEDYQTALKYYLISGEMGNGFAYFYAGELYEQGKLSEDGAPDYENAKTYYILAAEAPMSNCKGLRNIGQWYETGNSYVERDYQEAAYYYAWAIEIDDASSCYYLGNLYEQGYLSEDGAPDYINAAKYYQQAYDKNNIGASGVSTAVYRLAYFYENGLGVEQNLELAKKYYQAVADSGKPEAADAQAALDRLNSETALPADPGATTAPKTGDAANAAVWMLLAAASVCGAVMLRRRLS